MLRRFASIFVQPAGSTDEVAEQENGWITRIAHTAGVCGGVILAWLLIPSGRSFAAAVWLAIALTVGMGLGRLLFPRKGRGN